MRDQSSNIAMQAMNLQGDSKLNRAIAIEGDLRDYAQIVQGEGTSTCKPKETAEWS